MIGWHPLDIFKGTLTELTSHPEEADFIFCGEPLRLIKGKWQEQDTIDFYKPQLEELSLLKRPMLCANPDKISDSNDAAGVAVRAGALADYYQKIGGHVDYIGKPYADLYDFALQDIGDKSSALMVGDTLETDILGAQNAGIDSALTLCGMTARQCNRSDLKIFLPFASAKALSRLILSMPCNRSFFYSKSPVSKKETGLSVFYRLDECFFALKMDPRVSQSLG